jgi:hypothetical protein
MEAEMYEEHHACATAQVEIAAYLLLTLVTISSLPHEYCADLYFTLMLAKWIERRVF